MPEAERIRARSSFTEQTFDIAIHLATKITCLSEQDRGSAIDVAYLIEKELDRYIQDGTIQFVSPENRR